MSVTAEQYIELIGSDTENLNKTVAAYLADTTTLSCSLLLHCWAAYADSKQLLKSVVKMAPAVVIDPNEKLLSHVELAQKRIKESYHLMAECGFFNPFVWFSRSFVKKTFDNYDLIIINIREHDIDADKTPYSEAFDSVDDLMKQLHS